jgi:hypothetical protein
MTSAIGVLSESEAAPRNRRVLNTAAVFSAQVTKSLLLAAGICVKTRNYGTKTRRVTALLLSGWRHDAQVP